MKRFLEENIIVKAIITEDTEIIPVWDDRLKYDESDGDSCLIYDGYKYFKTFDVVYNLKTKTISKPICIFEKRGGEEFPIGLDVVYEKEFNRFAVSRIIDIVYDDDRYIENIMTGLEFLQYIKSTKNKLENINDWCNIIEEELYIIRSLNPVWVLEDCTKIYSYHKMKHLFKSTTQT